MRQNVLIYKRGENMRGLYIHIPFCLTKCGYCDFYSLKYNSQTVENYVEAMIKKLKSIDYIFDTVYFGGGTPSAIGAENLSEILSHTHYKENAEITVEVNPKSFNNSFFDILFENGFNRISIGMQSAADDELKKLSRNHKFSDVKETVAKAKKAGFKNISLDIMLGIEGQTINSLKETLDKAISLQPTHLSCYMLKIEEGTPFSKAKLDLPCENDVCDMYLFLCEYLEKNGYNQYEISNFAKNEFQSKHNLLYWKCKEYLGLGPAAHSFIDSKRYYYPNDINYFLEGKEMIFEDTGGDLYDYIMLGLRLKEGLDISRLDNKNLFKKIQMYCEKGFGAIKNNRFSLNTRGFLVQNTILCDLLEEIQ